jgi:ABC-type multidrug transport system ATPase subunit
VGRLAQLPRSITAPRAGELLEQFDLAEAADRPIRTYSGGMRRRLDVAAALVARPPVLFLDEPTTGLDLHSRNALWDTIRELVAEGTTVLLTTQYLEEADRLARSVVVVDQGRVIAEGTPAELKAKLGRTVIEFGMRDGDDAARAVGLLADAEPEREGDVVRLPSSDGPRDLMGLLRALDEHGVYPATLTVRDPSLDDVFLRLTGRHAEAGDPQPTAVPVGGDR